MNEHPSADYGADAPWGFVVGERFEAGRFWYAEMEPSASNRRWRCWHTRWWWEIHSYAPGDDVHTTHAYQKGGSGGAMTLRTAVRQVCDAIDRLARDDASERAS